MVTYYIIVAFLLILAVFDLFVGVSNDAVNFLNSAVGSRSVKFRTLLIVVSMGVMLGAMMSAGMMDVARHGILCPQNFSFAEVMTIYLAVMVTDVVVLDLFNTFGMPTSTTVSLVFELLGGTFVLALIKMWGDPSLNLSMLLNTEKALSVIIAIFVSVAIAFFFGVVVQWLARLAFTFNYKKHLKFAIAPFGGVAFTALMYFIFLKGLLKSPYIDPAVCAWIDAHTTSLLWLTFAGSTLLMEVLHLLKVNVFRIIILLGSFALAMAFAGNDLVNFIGVPLAGLDAINDYAAHGQGQADTYMMTCLMESVKSPFIYLLLAGLIMVASIFTSKKAQNVIKKSVDLSRQDEGEEMFGSSRVARILVRIARDMGNAASYIVPPSVTRWIDGRFDRRESSLIPGAAFDEVRASVNIVVAAMLIIIGTNYKLPLSTTYVTFMVAMGSSLADKAWDRDCAVFRVTGVLSVIGGWFLTAGIAFSVCGVVCFLMHYGGFAVMLVFMALDIFLLYRSSVAYKKKEEEGRKGDMFQLMMQAQDKDFVWDLLRKNISSSQSYITRFVIDQYHKIVEGMRQEDIHTLRSCEREIKRERDLVKRLRKQQLLAMKRIPAEKALERNTWYHLSINTNDRFLYCLLRMLEPIKEHVDNNFRGVPATVLAQFDTLRVRTTELMKEVEGMIGARRFNQYDEAIGRARELKQEMALARKGLIDRMQLENGDMKAHLLYLNLVQETLEMVSVVQQQLRACKKFLE